MAANPPTNPYCKTTLIVVPLNLLEQWVDELRSKSTLDYDILMYHKSNGKLPTDPEEIKRYDVVVTTYDKLVSEWPDPDAEIKALSKGEPSPRKQEAGPLTKINWYRIVLDEAHIIRNPKSKRSLATYSLDAIHRWCLTGTPICNRLLDIFAHLRFLRQRPYNQIQEFRKHIIKTENHQAALAGQRAQALLKTCLLRRNKASTIDGKPLLILPKKHIQHVVLQFCKEEREIYDALERRMQVTFNRYLKAGRVFKVRRTC